ncbi:hypothetical protein DERP_001349 [Dermatophagoides pteronyssinus]|uniref:Uncharacterized protein n=1 Tax=Dermatophagoides pteronyssinus TaxID=6956 RepID=A0ABQ8JER0_DERPT|nr:hypothetical protein DERP_001349 [Dermatophagoides pteronyssinus]
MATNLKPLASKRRIISPTMPRCTASGFSMINVRSVLADILQIVLLIRRCLDVNLCKKTNGKDNDVRKDEPFILLLQHANHGISACHHRNSHNGIVTTLMRNDTSRAKKKW